MPTIQPAQMRSIISDSPDGLRIIIPTHRNWFLLLFLSFWLCGWAFGEVTALNTLFRSNTPTNGALFLTVWLTFWTLGGGFAIYAWLWNVAGREVLLINEQTLTTRREVFGRGRPNVFDRTHLNNLRISPIAYNPWDWKTSLYFWGIGGGTIAFDYGAKTYRFGTRIEEAEAKQIIQAIKHRFTIPEDALQPR